VPAPHVHAVPSDIQSGQSSRFTCPDCGGVLWEFRDGTVERFRCSVGHAYSIQSLFGEQSHQLEAALWAAVRTLEDRALLLRRMERESRARGSHRSATAFESRARSAADRASLIRDAIHGVTDVPEPEALEGAGDVG
jgi:two-component system chemotaxis response regulator CheB